MNDAKQRVIDERTQLHERIIKLHDFIEWNENFKKITADQQFLLRLQLRTMIMYREILDQRLDNWKDVKKEEGGKSNV